MQNAFVDRPNRNLQEITDLLNARVPELCDIFFLEEFQHTGEAATVRVKGMLNYREQRVEVTDQTNAGMLRFDLG